MSCGYFGGRFDTIVMRIVDVFMCLPPLLFSLSIVAALGNGMGNLILAVSITMTPFFTRVIRATVMSVMSMDYIEAARAAGATHLHIILRHVIPNCMGPIIVEATISLSMMIMLAASLSFIGMGVQPPSPEWGAMLSDAREYMRDVALDGAGAGPCHHDHLPGLQPAGRRCARRAGPAHEEVRRSA